MRIQPGVIRVARSSGWVAGSISLLLLSTSTASAQITRMSASGVPTADPSCRELIKSIHPNIPPVTYSDDARVLYHLYSNPDFIDGTIGTGHWVGVIKRPTGGVQGNLFPRVTEIWAGCLSFRAEQSSTNPGELDVVSALSLEYEEFGKGQRAAAVFCRDTAVAHNRHQKPVVIPDAGNCPVGSRVSVTILDTKLKQPEYSVAYTLTKDGIAKGFMDEIGQRNPDRSRLSLAITFEQLADKLRESGPWFPCGLTDCCRTF